MNKVLAEHMKASIECLPFVDKLGGLVKTKIEKSREKKDIKYPVYCLDDKCKDPRFTPDQNKKSVIYFESDAAPKVLDETMGLFRMQSDISCIGWLNLKALGYDESIVHKVTLPIFKAITGIESFHDKPLAHIKFQFLEEKQADKTLFSKYTYSQYKDWVGGQYEVFGLKFRCTFYISRGCIDDFQLKAKIC